MRGRTWKLCDASRRPYRHDTSHQHWYVTVPWALGLALVWAATRAVRAIAWVIDTANRHNYPPPHGSDHH